MTTKQQLTHLESTGLLRLAQTHPELEYLFRHALVQDAAYESLLLADRKQLHRQVAETLERLYPDRLDELAAVLGHHFVKAGDVEKAIHYLVKAGDQARGLHANQEAIEFYQQALALLKEQGDYNRTARILMKMGLTYHNAFDFKRAHQTYEEGFELWQQARDMQSTDLLPASQVLRLAWGDPITLNPTQGSDLVSGGVIHQIFSRLVEISPEKDIVPEAAQSWEILAGGQKYVFHLRDDAYWSNGVPVTAADFEFAWKQVLNPVTEAPLASLLYDIKGAKACHQGDVTDLDHIGVRALDAATLEVELEKPTSYFLYVIAYCTTFPIPKHIATRHGNNWATPELIVTNGPFKVETWNRGQTMTLTRNLGYCGHFTGNVERVELTLQTDRSANLNRYEADQLDVLPLLSSEVVRIRQQYAGEHFSAPSLMTWHLSFDVSRPPFNDRRVRRAVALAINQEMYADEIAQGTVIPATGGFVPPGMSEHTAGIALPYNPEQAQQLLTEAGYPNGRNFPSIIWLAHPEQVTLAEFLQVQLRNNLGLEIDWEAPDHTEYYNRMSRPSSSMILARWLSFHPDPDYFLRIFIETNWHTSGWKKKKLFDTLVEDARRVTNQQARLKLYRQADRLLIDEAPIIPLVHEPNHVLVKPWVKKYPIMWSSAIAYWKDVIIEPH